MDVLILSVCCYNGSVDVGETSGGGGYTDKDDSALVW